MNGALLASYLAHYIARNICTRIFYFLSHDSIFTFSFLFRYCLCWRCFGMGQEMVQHCYVIKFMLTAMFCLFYLLNFNNNPTIQVLSYEIYRPVIFYTISPEYMLCYVLISKCLLYLPSLESTQQSIQVERGHHTFIDYD